MGLTPLYSVSPILNSLLSNITDERSYCKDIPAHSTTEFSHAFNLLECKSSNFLCVNFIKSTVLYQKLPFFWESPNTLNRRDNNLRFDMNSSATLTSKTYRLRENKIASQHNWNWLFNLIGQRIEGIEVRDAKLARLLCRLIPARCPFERTVQLFGHTLLQIPPLCKLNPFYEQLMVLRFRALSFLADTCGEDVAKYCC